MYTDALTCTCIYHKQLKLSERKVSQFIEFHLNKGKTYLCDFCFICMRCIKESSCLIKNSLESSYGEIQLGIKLTSDFA